MHKSRYTPLTQQRFCCMPTSIQMVLLRRKLPMMSQEQIGYELGLIVPKSYKKIFPRARTGRRPAAGWGTQESKYPLNKFFSRHGIPLRSQFSRPSGIPDIAKWIKENVRKGSDILVCFDYKILYGGHGRGHLSVIDSITGNTVTLIDPGRGVPKYRKVKLSKLINAMEKHGKTGGFHLIISAKKR